MPLTESELRSHIEYGEGEKLEFKEKYTVRDETRAEAVRDLIAMANTQDVHKSLSGCFHFMHVVSVSSLRYF